MSALRPVFMGETIMRRNVYKALLTGAALGVCLSFLAMAAQEVNFKDTPCPLSVREAIGDHLGTETELSSFEVLGLVNDEVLVIRYDGDKIGYVAWEEIGEKIPELAYANRDAIPSVSDFENLENGSDGDLVREAQQALSDLGFTEGGVDGMYGPGTAASVSAFQADAGLEATGVIDAVTWFALTGAADEQAAGRSALTFSYPPEYTSETKYAMIIDSVDDPEYLDQFLDPEWKIDFDVFGGEGRIDYTADGVDLGTEKAGKRKVDKVTLDASAYVQLKRGDRGAVALNPVIEIKATGTHRPYISDAVMQYGVFSEKMAMASQECVLDDQNSLETTLLALSPQIYKLLRTQTGGSDLTLQLTGLESSYTLDLTPYLDKFSAFVEACYNVPLKDEESALELTVEEEEELGEETTEEEETEAESAEGDVDTGAAAYDSAVDVLTPRETEISDYTGGGTSQQTASDEYALDAPDQGGADDVSSGADSNTSDMDMALSAGESTGE